MIQDQTHTEASTQNIKESIPIETLGTDTFLKIVRKIHHEIKNKVIQTIEIEFILKVDHTTTPKIDHIMTKTILDHVLIPGIETTTPEIDRETTRSHHIEIRLNIHIQKVETTESSTPKTQIQINQVQSTEETQPNLPRFYNTENPELQLNHLDARRTNPSNTHQNKWTVLYH